VYSYIVYLPLLLGVGVCIFFWILDRTPLLARGVSPSYISAVALLFSLYGGLMAKEVWDKLSRIEVITSAETNALRSMLRLSEAVDPYGRFDIDRKVTRYVNEVREKEYNIQANEESLLKSKSLQYLYNMVAREDVFPDDVIKSHFLSAVEALHSARLERISLQLHHISETKLAILFLFGFLTQIAIALTHAGHRGAILSSVMLFSIAFSGSIYVLLEFDDPYQISRLLSVKPVSGVE